MRKVLLAAVLVLVASGAQAATLNVVNGQLMGASDVLVDGSLYDVQWGVPWPCFSLRYCDEVSDLTFQTSDSALLAAQALLDQVLLDGPLGLFDSVPSLTSGTGDCYFGGSDPPWVREGGCIATLYSDFIDPIANETWRLYSVAFNDPSLQDSVATCLYPYSCPFTNNTAFAFWTPVPEPSTALLLGLGLAGLAARRRPAAAR